MSAEKIFVVCGPTATGKTRLGIELARRYGGEIVSADSMQVYCGMDIGTAKADAAERAAAPHHMLDVADPGESYSVARYVQEATRCCEDILSRGRLPVVVGGTGLYIDALIAGRDFAETDTSSDEGLREKLNADYKACGGAAMLARLREVDPARADKLAPGDRRRIVRALEVWALTGKTISEHDEQTQRQPPRFEARRIVLSYASREMLYARIDRRVEEMVRQGLFKEVEGLLAGGLSPDSTAMQAIGYKEAALALRGEISRDEAIAQIQQASRRYAKRQLTWFRRAGDALWIEWPGEVDTDAALALVQARFGEKLR